MSSSENNCAKKFGWKEIPFEPLGVDTGKYPILRAEDFDELQKAAKITRQEGKFDIRLLRAPQGAGKTALSSEIKNTFASDKDVFVIFHQLMSMDPIDLTKQVIDQISNNNVVSKDFINSLGFSPSKNYTKTELRDFVLKVIDEAIRTKTFGIWILDEFDTISSAETTEGEKSEFLQWLRSIIDGIANSKLIHGKGMLMIMAHTEKSAEEFGRELKNLHGPMQERIMSTGTIEIGYKLHEVRNIILTRINHVRISGTATFSIDPFTDDAISTLYERINYVNQTREMTSFRLFEKTCYTAIINACESNSNSIGIKEIEIAFQQIQKTLFHDPSSSNLSADTLMETSKILRSEENVHNTTILAGFFKGVSNFMESVIEDAQLKSSRSVKQTESGLYFNEMTLIVEPKLKKSEIAARIYCVSKKKESFNDDDFKEISNEIKNLENDRVGINLTLLCLIADKESVPLDEEYVKEKIPVIDAIFLINKKLKTDLITLECCKEEEIETLQQPFNQFIRSKLTDYITSSVQDITFTPSESVILLIKMSNLLSIVKEDSTYNHLQTETGKFFSRTKPLKKAIAEMIQLGFAKEESGNLIPLIPKTLENAFQLIKSNKIDSMKDFHNYEKIIKAAFELGIVDENNNVVDIQTLTTQIEPIIENAKILVTNDDSKISNEIRLMLKAYDGIQSLNSEIRKIMLLNLINEEMKKRIRKINEYSSPTTVTKTQTDVELQDLQENDSEYENVEEDENSEEIEIENITPSSSSQSDEELLNEINHVLAAGPTTLHDLVSKLSRNGKFGSLSKGKIIFLIKDGKLKVSL